ncbi:MAG: peptidylprolyl isomerase [Euryarchaeota archaeon]|jgi:cyclophilin family peptidyl-prolyl cis-trans isomerase|nr:peptidylprolyl isomerase [Euryarchaeota archaeon]
MPVSEKLQNAWDKAENELIKGNDPDAALSTLRSLAWDSCEDAVQRAKTLSLAGNIYVIKADLDAPSRKANLKRAYKNYSNALKLDPKSKETLRERGKLTSIMDQEGISIGQSFQILDNGSPTPMGLLVGLVAILLLLSSVKVIADYAADSPSSASQATMQISYVPNGLDENSRTTATIVIDLYSEDAPNHVENFADHSRSGNYDATIFHRIIDNFMIQGGDFESGTGSGGYAHNWYGYCNGESEDSSSACPQTSWTVGDEANNGRNHVPGALSMAKTNAENTGGSQFFIVPEDSNPSHLDGVHTVFGQVSSGLSSVTDISNVETGDSDRPVYEVRLLSVVISA